MGLLVLDLDGVVWRGDRVIDGSADAVARLQAAGHDVVFCTNHAEPPALKRALLDQMSLPDAPVVTSAEAALATCVAGEGVLVLGSVDFVSWAASIHDGSICDPRSLEPFSDPPAVSTVIVGAHDDWDRDRIAIALVALRAGARFVATNTDPTFPVSAPDGRRWILPGNGALVSAVSTACGRLPTVAGKPHQPMRDLLVARFGRPDWVIGDVAETDGRLARGLGCRFGLVLSGATTDPGDDPSGVVADLIGRDLAELVDVLLEDERRGAESPVRSGSG